MPLYDFHCPQCDKTVELLARLDATPPCPACGAEGLQRLVSCIAPEGKSGEIIKAGRAQAAREGHFSNY